MMIDQKNPNAWAGAPFLPGVTNAQVFSDPNAAPAAPASLGMPTAPPQVFSTPPDAPNVVKAPTPIESQIDDTNQQLRKLQYKDANPYGSENNHPGVGGKILHALSRIGNIAGTIVAPAQMAMLPETDLGRHVQEQSLGARLQALTQLKSEDDNRDALTAKTKLETAEEPAKTADAHAQSQAVTRHTNDQAELLEHPLPQYEIHDTQQGPLFVNTRTGTAQRLSVDGVPVGPKLQTKTVQLEINGKPHQVLVNEQTGEQLKDLGPSGIKPPSVHVNNGDAALDREAKQFGAGHQKSLDSASSQIEKIDDARASINGSAEAQALGIPKVLTALVSGAGSGVRITQTELDSIAKARGFTGGIEGSLNEMNGKGKLTSTQQQQLTQVLDDVKARLVEKQNIARAALDSINGAPDRKSIIEADRAARENMLNLERFGHYAGQTVKLRNGQTVVIQHMHPDGSFD